MTDPSSVPRRPAPAADGRTRPLDAARHRASIASLHGAVAVALLAGAAPLAAPAAAQGTAPAAGAPAARDVGTGTVRGVVRDDAGAPVAAATVTVRGTTRATQTDEQGRFTLGGVPVGARTLEVRRIGFAAAELPMTVAPGAAGAEVAVALRRSALALEQVVVTGQGGAIAQRRLSTTVDVISRETVEASPATRVDQLLQAKLPGAQIRMTSGQPGTTSLIRTRGINSVSVNSTPVIYVDGVRVDNLNTPATLGMNISGGAHQGNATSALADLPLENIERIEHIPGGAATTLYGSDAANGVIQIFTRKGTAGATRVNARVTTGYDTPQTRFHHFDRTRDLLYRNGLTQQYALSVDGGTDAFSYSVAGGARAAEGHRVEGEHSSLNFRSGFSAALGRSGRYDGSLAFNRDQYPRFRNGNAGGYNSLWFVEGGRSFAFGFDNDIDAMSDVDFAELRNFVHRAEALQDNAVRVRRLTTSHAFSLAPTPSLTLKATLGLDQRLSHERAVTTNEFLIHTRQFPAGTADRGTLQNYERDFLGLSGELTAQHRADLGPLSVVSVLGGQLFRNDDNQVAYTATNVRDGARTIAGAGTTAGSDAAAQVANYGVFGQTNLGLRDRYFLELGLRADRNTAFGSTVGAQWYPKVGLSYDVSTEEWFRRAIPERLVPQLRLRGNYGVAGNFPRPFANDRTVTFHSLHGALAASYGQPGDPTLRPERTHTVEGGLDASLLGDRVTLGVTAYHSTTRDALLNAPSPPSTGQGTQLRNVGEIENRGTELRASVVPYDGPRARLTISGSHNTLRNRMVSTGGTPVFNLGGLSERTIQAVVEEGFPVGYLRGPRATFNPDGTIRSVEQLQYLGKPHPDGFGSLSATLALGSRLTISADGDYQYGAQAHSFDRHFRFQYGLPGDDVPDAAVEAAGGPAAIWLDVFNMFVEDTDYAKLRTVSVDFRLPERFVPRGARSARVAVAATNLLAWSTSTFDPEVDLSGAIGQGGAAVGGFNYSTDSSPRSFLLTISLGF